MTFGFIKNVNFITNKWLKISLCWKKEIHNTWLLLVLLQENENGLHKHFLEATAIYTQFICYLFGTAMHYVEVSKSL